MKVVNRAIHRIASLLGAGFLSMALAVQGAPQEPAASEKQIVRSVPLYYVRDAVRLLKMLNPDVDVTGGSLDYTNLDAKRRAVIEKEADVQKTAATIAGLKVRKAAVLEEQKDAQQDLLEAESTLKAEQRKQDSLQRDFDRKNQKLADVQAEFNAATPEQQVAIQSRLDAAKADKEAASDKLEKQKGVVQDATADRNEIKEKLDGKGQEIKGLDQQITELDTQLTTATGNLFDARKALLLAEADEDAAISAFARQAPMIISKPSADSTDPVRKISIFAFPDRAMLILRGAKNDVEEAEEIIAQYDEPAPQARLTVYEMQVNVTQDNKGKSSYVEAQGKVLKTLSDLRHASSDVTQAFVNAVNGEANKAPTQQDLSTFYHQEAMKAFDDSPPNPRNFSSFGEAVMFFLLANKTTQDAIWTTFSGEFNNEKSSIRTLQKMLGVTEDVKFERFGRAIKSPDGAKPGDLTPAQSELIRGIAARLLPIRGANLAKDSEKYRPLILAQVRRLLLAKQIPAEAQTAISVASEDTLVQTAVDKLGRNLVKEVIVKVTDELADKDPKYQEFSDKEIAFLQDLKLMTGASFENPKGTDAVDYMLSESNLRILVPRTIYNARVAAADAVVKQIIISFEDDLHDAVLRQGFEKLTKQVTARGLSFGQMKKTSLLVTNRQFGSVTGRAEAEVAPSQEKDILGDIKRLLELTTAAPGANPAGLLGVLQKQDKEQPYKPAEIYGLTSNGSFRVTPAFEPTGQALRFRFEYSLRNTIREPNGTVNPRIPMVERHSIDNEVQIGNFEIREVSSFGVNGQLGLPTKKWGGIPILKDIPVLSEIPLIGWFHWRGGRSAIAQESIVFAQTAMYPTLGDIVNLLGVTRNP